MGNKPFKIFVRLDQNVCKAGETVTGKVYLSIGMLADVKHFRGIHLCLNGVERSEVAFKPGTLEYDKRRRLGKPMVERSTQTIVHVDYPLVDITGISRGQYEYPFELPLRGDLQSSMQCSLGDADKSFCEIKYTLTAYVVTDESPMTTNYELSHELLLSMKSAPPNEEGPRPISTNTEIYPISTCWFWSQGHIALGWSSDRSVAAPGDYVHVRLWGENQSKLEVEYISVKWMETVTWQVVSGSEQKRQKRLLAEQRISARPHPQWHSTIASDHHQGLLSNHRNNIQDTSGDQHPSLLITLKIPNSARDTYKGPLVEVKHALVVCVLTSGGYCSSTPESSRAVRICQGTGGVATSVAASVAAQPIPVPAMVPPPLYFDNVEYSDVNPSYSSQQQPLVQAQALPDDWHAVEADVISLPLASAVVIPDSVGVSTVPCTPVASAPDEALVLGLEANNENNNGMTYKHGMTPSMAYNSKPRPTVAPESEALAQLAVLARDCPENLPVVLEDPIWVERIQNMTPHDFTQFVQAGGETYAAPIARTLALRMGQSFQTRHVLAGLWAVGDANRMELIREVAPLACDLRTKSSLIEDELSNEELAAFREATGKDTSQSLWFAPSGGTKVPTCRQIVRGLGSVEVITERNG